MKILLKSALKLTAALLAVLALSAGIVLPLFGASYKGIYEKTLRFHVLANSDSPEDQALKIKVRDDLIAFLSENLEECENREQAEKKIKQMLPQIEVCAADTLRREGSNDAVKAVLGKEYYPTRDYGEFSFPAGEYCSLRVYLGAGEGENWWCVVFPPLCTSAACVGERLEESGYSEKERGIVEKKDTSFALRFFLLDFAAKIRHFFS